LTAERNLTIVARGNHFQITSQERNIMGRGDKKTLRGKIFKGSYGKTRPHFPKKKPAAKPAGRK
jgi:30S ribosomal protein S31